MSLFYWTPVWESSRHFSSGLWLQLQHVHEELLGLRFRISPDAFFQTNSPATELLYRQVRDLCRHGNHSSEVSDVESLEAPTPAIYGR